MRHLLTTTLLCLSLACAAQKQGAVNLQSAKWKADSNGKAGFRKHAIQRVHSFYDVCGTYIIGYTKEQLIDLLGKPNTIATTAPLTGNDTSYKYYYLLESSDGDESDLVISIEKGHVTKSDVEFENIGVRVK